MNATQRAQDIADKLHALETAIDDLRANAPSTYATTVRNRTSILHNALNKGLDEQGGTLGISTTDQGNIQSGGAPKTYGQDI